ncbi:MAG: hypothetical protein IPH20_20275 [Bacteroidales bacterium]|nr:hypothetical protein [Bacteroidales bacterium]
MPAYPSSVAPGLLLMPKRAIGYGAGFIVKTTDSGLPDTNQRQRIVGLNDTAGFQTASDRRGRKRNAS